MTVIRWTVPLTALVALFVNQVSADTIPMAYCASINTAGTTANSSIWQSAGLCRDFCSGSWAFSVIKDSDCWCSDYVPEAAEQVNVDKCNTECPGYPSDTCGGDGLWGYIALDQSPSGTLGAGDVAQTTTKSSTTATTTSDVYVSTVTADGVTSQVTVTLSPTSSTGSGASTDGMSTGGTGLTTGAAVGIAVGVLGFFVIVGGIGVWLWMRKRKQQQSEAAVERSNSGRGSSAGMMSTPRTEMASIWDSEQMSTGKRNSRLMPHDPRMDPFAGNIYGHVNKSRESVNTLQDNQDYSRKVLRTTNPDPPEN